MLNRNHTAYSIMHAANHAIKAKPANDDNAWARIEQLQYAVIIEKLCNEGRA